MANNCHWTSSFAIFGEDLPSEQQAKLLKIVSFIVSVNAPMFFRIHSNPRAPDGPGNRIFLRNLLLDFRSQDLDLADMLKKTSTKHFVAWMNPTKIALNTHSKDPAFNLKDLQDPQQSLPENVNTESLTWQRASIKIFHHKEQTTTLHQSRQQIILE